MITMKISHVSFCRGIDDTFNPVPITTPVYNCDEIVGLFLHIVDIKNESPTVHIRWIHASGYHIEGRIKYAEPMNEIVICPHISPVYFILNENFDSSGVWKIIVLYNEEQIISQSFEILQKVDLQGAVIFDSKA